MRSALEADMAARQHSSSALALSVTSSPNARVAALFLALAAPTILSLLVFKAQLVLPSLSAISLGIAGMVALLAWATATRSEFRTCHPVGPVRALRRAWLRRWNAERASARGGALYADGRARWPLIHEPSAAASQATALAEIRTTEGLARCQVCSPQTSPRFSRSS